MSTPSSAAGSSKGRDPKPLVLLPATAPASAPNYEEVAGLVDVVADVEPKMLKTLLWVLGESRKLETQMVLQLAISCRDPLSRLGTICKDALQTRADLDRLVKDQQWSDLGKAIKHPDVRACALLNVCEGEIARLRGKTQARYRAIQPRLVEAAAAERIKRGDEIRMLAALRDALFPRIWETFEHWLDKT